LLREQIHPPVGDFVEGPLEFAVVRWHGLEVLVPLECTAFLSKLPPEPKWIRDARTRTEKQLASALRSRMKRSIPVDLDQHHTEKRVARKRKSGTTP
jgi:hypothetical protein